MAKIKTYRTAKVFFSPPDDDKVCVSLEEGENNKLTLCIYGADGKFLGRAWMTREEWLDLFVSLYPNEVAYQFKKDEND